jgi:hypothetical protein
MRLWFWFGGRAGNRTVCGICTTWGDGEEGAREASCLLGGVARLLGGDFTGTVLEGLIMSWGGCKDGAERLTGPACAMHM